MNLARLLEKTAGVRGSRPAIALGGTTILRHDRLARRVGALAGALKDGLAMAPGDRVAMAMNNCPAFLEVLLAAWHAGLAVVPMNAKLHAREFAYILEDSGARLCFATARQMPAVAPLADELATLDVVIDVGGDDYSRLFAAESVGIADVDPADLAWLFYTSGTTGRPKGAMLSHRNLLMMTMSYLADIDGVNQRDTILHAAPMSHGSGLYALPHLARGACQVIPESGGFDVAEIRELFGAHGGISLFLAPTMVTRLLGDPGIGAAAADHLKTIIYGGGPMYVADCRRALDTFGPKLVQIYGQGEAPMTITALSKADHADRNHPRYLARLASVGVARTDVEVRIVNGEDADVPHGETGEVLVRGDVVMTGYWRNEGASAAALKGGWLYTGDLGSLDADGYLTLRDRSKDVVISGGSNIYPREVEEVLLRHQDVLEASVVGRPHAEWGEEVVAFIVARQGAALDGAALDAMCLERIARFKRPRHYRFLAALPKNHYGKVLKTELRRLLAAPEDT